MRFVCGGPCLLALVAACGCDSLGYSDHVLVRAPSPDGTMVAVCQEIPVFDGPDYDIRLERPDGTKLRGLYQIGDGDPCSEVVWSPDGRLVGVLSSHVRRIRIVDVAWALEHAETQTRYWSWREINIEPEAQGRSLATGLQFVGPLEIEIGLCERAGRTPDCAAAPVRKRFRIPAPIVTGHP